VTSRVTTQFDENIHGQFLELLDRLPAPGASNCVVRFKKEGFEEVVLRNLDFDLESVDRLVRGHSLGHEEFVRLRRAIADSSFVDRPERRRRIVSLVSRLSDRIPGSYCYLTCTVDKRSLSVQSLRTSSMIRAETWLTSRNFRKYYSGNLDATFRLLWGKGYPLIVLSDLAEPFNTAFASFGNSIEIRESELAFFETRALAHARMRRIAESLSLSDFGKLVCIHWSLLPLKPQDAERISQLGFSTFLEGISYQESAETDLLELKGAEYLEVARTVASFANRIGGLLVIGISDETREIEPFPVTDQYMERISNQIGSIKPHPPPHLILTPEVTPGKKIVLILVMPSVEDPVYSLSKGEVPVRVGSSTQYFSIADPNLCDRVKEQRRKLLSRENLLDLRD